MHAASLGEYTESLCAEVAFCSASSSDPAGLTYSFASTPGALGRVCLGWFGPGHSNRFQNQKATAGAKEK